jgi:hypothetical protein
LKSDVVIPARERLRASPESITPGVDQTDRIAITRHCGVSIPGLRSSRLRRLKRIPE